MKTTLLHNQSLIDIAIQVTGIAENAIFIAKENDCELTQEIKAGTLLIISTRLKIDKDIVNYYTVNNIKPATALTQNQLDEVKGCEGIGCWAIESDFVVI